MAELRAALERLEDEKALVEAAAAEAGERARAAEEQLAATRARLEAALSGMKGEVRGDER